MPNNGFVAGGMLDMDRHPIGLQVSLQPIVASFSGDASRPGRSQSVDIARRRISDVPIPAGPYQYDTHKKRIDAPIAQAIFSAYPMFV